MAKFASRRSSSPPPQKAKQVKRRGTVHRPLRWNPDSTATAQVEEPSPPTIRDAQLPSCSGRFSMSTLGAVTGPTGRSRVIGASSP